MPSRDQVPESNGRIVPFPVLPARLQKGTTESPRVGTGRETRTHCPKGHELAEGNLVPSHLRKGWRVCLTCWRERVAGASEEARDRP